MSDLNINFNNSTFHVSLGGSSSSTPTTPSSCLTEFLAELDKIRTAIVVSGDSTMSILASLQAKVAANNEVIGSAIVLIQGLKAKLDDAIASGDPAVMQALSDSLGQSDTALADAIAANTPSDTPPAPAPVDAPAPAPVDAPAPAPVDAPAPAPEPAPAPVEAPADPAAAEAAAQFAAAQGQGRFGTP